MSFKAFGESAANFQLLDMIMLFTLPFRPPLSLPHRTKLRLLPLQLLPLRAPLPLPLGLRLRLPLLLPVRLSHPRANAHLNSRH